jgi:ATP-binding cassette subfamily F protein uup
LHDADLFAREPERFAALTATLTDLRAKKDAAEERWLEVAELAEEISR